MEDVGVGLAEAGVAADPHGEASGVGRRQSRDRLGQQEVFAGDRDREVVEAVFVPIAGGQRVSEAIAVRVVAEYAEAVLGEAVAGGRERGRVVRRHVDETGTIAAVAPARLGCSDHELLDQGDVVPEVADRERFPEVPALAEVVAEVGGFVVEASDRGQPAGCGQKQVDATGLGLAHDGRDRCTDRQLVFARVAHVAGGECEAEAAPQEARDGEVRRVESLHAARRDAAARRLAVEDVDGAVVAVLSRRTDGEVGVRVVVEVTGRQRPAELVEHFQRIALPALIQHFGRGRGEAGRPAEIDPDFARTRGRVEIAVEIRKPDGQVVVGVVVEVAGGERDAEVHEAVGDGAHRQEVRGEVCDAARRSVVHDDRPVLAAEGEALVLARSPRSDVVVSVAVEVSRGQSPTQEVVLIRNLGGFLALPDDRLVGVRRNRGRPEKRGRGKQRERKSGKGVAARSRRTHESSSAEARTRAPAAWW